RIGLHPVRVQLHLLRRSVRDFEDLIRSVRRHVQVAASASLRKAAHQLLSREECETFKAALRAFRETTTAGQLISSLEKIIDSPKKLSLLREIALLLPMEQRRDFIRMLKDDSAPRVIKLNSATFQVRYKSQISPITGLSQGDGSVSVVQIAGPSTSSTGALDSSSNSAAAPVKFQSLGFVRQQHPQISVIKEESPTDEANTGSGARGSPAGGKSPAKTASSASASASAAASTAQDPDDELMERIKNQMSRPRPPLAALQDKGFWALNSPRRNLQEQRKQERRLLQESASELMQAHASPSETPQKIVTEAIVAEQPPPQPQPPAQEEIHIMPCHDETNHGICDVILDRPDSEITTGFSTDTDTEAAQPVSAAALAAAAALALSSSAPPTCAFPESSAIDGEATPPAENHRDVAETSEDVETAVEAEEKHEDENNVDEDVVKPSEAVTQQSEKMEKVAKEDSEPDVVGSLSEDSSAQNAHAVQDDNDDRNVDADAEPDADFHADAAKNAPTVDSDSREASDAEREARHGSADLISRRSVSMVEVASAATARTEPRSGGEDADAHDSQARLRQVREKSSSLQRDTKSARLGNDGCSSPPPPPTMPPTTSAASAAMSAAARAKFSSSPPVADNQLYRMLYGPSTGSGKEEDDQVSVTSSVLESEYLKSRLIQGWPVVSGPVAATASTASATSRVTAGCQTESQLTPEGHADFGLQVSMHSDYSVGSGGGGGGESAGDVFRRLRPVDNREIQCDLGRPLLQDSTTSPAESLNLPGSRRRTPPSPLALSLGKPPQLQQQNQSPSPATEPKEAKTADEPKPNDAEDLDEFPHPAALGAAAAIGSAPNSEFPFGYFFPPPPPPPPQMMMSSQTQSRPISPMSRSSQQQQPQVPYSSSYPGNLFFQWMTGQMMMQAAAAQMPYAGFSPADFFNQLYGQHHPQQQQPMPSEPDVRQITLVKAGGTFGLSVTMAKREGDLPAVLVSAVATGSPAYQQGIQPGDELLELEGEKVSNMTLHQLGMAIRNQSKIRLSIRAKHKTDSTA
uniref:PDZ domain-containing protein n=1 Tax=Macrostomum lignano TaxID=282301 RepID=A0A1I8J0D0_9PLAT